jgi:hypothetical protein
LFVLLAWASKKGIVCFKKRPSFVSDIIAHSPFISTTFLFLGIIFQTSVMIQPFMSAVRNSVCNVINFQILTSSVVLRFLAVLTTATDLTEYILGTWVVLHMSFLVQVVIVHPIKAYGGGIAPLILIWQEMMASGQCDAPAALWLGDKALGTHSIRCWVDPREGLSTSEKRKKSVVSARNGNTIPRSYNSWPSHYVN